MARPPLYARAPTDPAEERTLRKLAAARHAPASLIQRARIITASWDGASVAEVAQRLGCHPKTVSKWLHRFNQIHGIDALADLPRPGLPRRITEGASPRLSAAASSPWPARSRPAAWSRAVKACWRLPNPRRQRTGPWTPWPSAPRPRGSGWAAASSAASSKPSGCAGGPRAHGRKAPTPSSPQTSHGHRPLHHPAAGGDRGLRRQAGPSDPPQLPARIGLVTRHPTGIASRRRWRTAVAWTRPGCMAACGWATATR